MTSQPFRLFLCCAAVLLSAFGCGDAGTTTDTADTGTAPPVLQAATSDEPEVITTRDLRRRLRANEAAKFERVGTDIVEAHLFQSGVKDISALKGLPLRFLDLGMCDVTDISAIEGMPLSTLILENTKVSDISVVKGMQLEVLQLQETPVTDVSALAGMPIRELNLKNIAVDKLDVIATLPLMTLWIPGTKVSDISQLAGKPMVSLDIEGTAVSSLDALATMTTLKRLNIVNTPITDLTPLKDLRLERIALTPQTITTGIEVLRSMPSLTQILTTMEGNPQQSAADFWHKFDTGVWNPKTEEPAAKADGQPAANPAPAVPPKEEPPAEPAAPAADEKAETQESDKKE
jgi:hypothetical protein